MMKCCLLLVIISVVENAHQFSTIEEEIYHDSSSEKIFVEETFDLCQSILTQIISRLEHKVSIYRLLQQTGTHVNYWMFEKRISNPNHWCKSKSEQTPVVHFSWNPEQNYCVNLEVFNYNSTPNFTEYICDLNINTSNVQIGFTDPTLNTGIMTKSNSITKRSLTKKFIHSYVNLAKEIESTECSSPTLNVYLNQQLVFSNASEVVSNDIPIDTIEVYLNVDLSSFTNSLPAKTTKRYLIRNYKRTYLQAKDYCSGQGMTLLTVRSKEETDEVVAAMYKNNNYNFWISGNKLSGDWTWSDGERIDYTNWNGGEPNNAIGNEYCIEIMKQRGTWNDNVCNVKQPFICEKILSRTEGAKISPKVNIFVGDKLAYQKLPEYGSNIDLSNVVEVKIGVDGNALEDHTTKFLLLRKNSPQEAASEQRLVTPRNSINTEVNGVDIRIEQIEQKGLSCQREKTYDVHTDVKLIQLRLDKLYQKMKHQAHDIKMLTLQKGCSDSALCQFIDKIEINLLFSFKLSYVDAQKFCRNRSTQLVSIQNEKQHLDIEKIMLKLNIDHYYWTYGYLAADGATWLWNGNEAVTYSNWAKGEPNNVGGNEKCIEIYVPWKTAKWNDQECQDRNRIICESFSEPYWQREKE